MKKAILKAMQVKDDWENGIIKDWECQDKIATIAEKHGISYEELLTLIVD